jgi:serine/threonine protein kinase
MRVLSWTTHRALIHRSEHGDMMGAHADPTDGRTRRRIPSSSSWGFAEGDELVPGYACLRLLGGGARYEVYLAFDERRHAVVVVKILRPDRVSNVDALEGLAGEARALSRLDHPVLIRGFGAEPQGPRPHLVLEHVEGPRLSTTIRRHGPLAIEQALPLGLQVASALHYLSIEGFVHLDVKPSNIIMAGPPRLIDLSIARTPAEARRSRGPLGTDAYMAPEQRLAERRTTIGPAADVWGLGATLYEGLIGTVPPREGTRTEDEPARLPERGAGGFARGTPAPLVELVMSCLRDDPTERPSALELALELEPVVAAIPRRVGLRRLVPR